MSAQPTSGSGRLVVSGSILVDLMLKVDALPQPGADLLTRASEFTVGGGFNVLVAAHRQGTRTAYAGRIGSGPLGQMVQAALIQVQAEILLASVRDGDTGFCLVIVDASAERTMLTTMGVDAELTEQELASLQINAGDTVYVSGYDLAYPHGPALADWLVAIDPDSTVIFDPGPLVTEIPAQLIEAALQRANWVSLNRDESLRLTGSADQAHAAELVLAHNSKMRGVITRNGADGCLLKLRGQQAQPIPGFKTSALDTTGAGDCHVGTFAAAVIRGLAPHDACVNANAAAAIAVSRWGPATAPTRDETTAFLAEHDRELAG